MRLIFLLSFLVISLTIVSAIDSCDRAFIRGDANGDSIIDISDPIYLLNYLFQAGHAPVNELGQEEIFGADPIDNPPELGFLYLDSDEVTLQNLPTTFFVLDSSGERDMKHCSVYAESDFGRFSILETNWENVGGAEFKGNDITSHPLEFIIGKSGDGILPGFNYILNVQCIDMAGQEGIVKLKINVIGEEETKPQTCRNGQDIACIYFGEPTLADDAVVCLYDSDYNEETGEDEAVCEPNQDDCNILEGVPVPGGHITEIGEWKPTSTSTYNSYPENKKQGFVDACLEREQISYNKNNLEFIPLQSPGGNTGGQSTTKQPCWVEKMTIYRKPADASKVDGFNIPKSLLSGEQQRGIIGQIPFLSQFPNPDPLLGHFEGWTSVFKLSTGSPFQYEVGYGFLLVATLYKGSEPDSCPEAQFMQFRKEFSDSNGMSKISLKRSGKSRQDQLPEFMYTKEEIEKKSLKELNLPPDDNTHFSSLVEFYPGNVPDLDKRFCLYGSATWCNDDHLEPRTGEIYGKVYDFKKHFKGTEAQSPKIIWWDGPGVIIGSKKITGQTISKSDVIKREGNYIGIVEDSHPRSPDESGNIWRQRFRCELTALIIENSPSVTGKFKVTEPTCFCIQQRRLEGGPNFVQGKTGEWSEISGSKKEC